jgi:hypothetical protein
MDFHSLFRLKCFRNKLKERVKKASKFFQICQGFDRGLLCLLPFMEIFENQLYNMTTAEIDEFQSTTSAVVSSSLACYCIIRTNRAHACRSRSVKPVGSGFLDI